MSDGLNVPSMGNKNKRQRFADEMKVEVNKKEERKATHCTGKKQYTKMKSPKRKVSIKRLAALSAVSLTFIGGGTVAFNSIFNRSSAPELPKVEENLKQNSTLSDSYKEVIATYLVTGKIENEKEFIKAAKAYGLDGLKQKLAEIPNMGITSDMNLDYSYSDSYNTNIVSIGNTMLDMGEGDSNFKNTLKDIGYIQWMQHRNPKSLPLDKAKSIIKNMDSVLQCEYSLTDSKKLIETPIKENDLDRE